MQPVRLPIKSLIKSPIQSPIQWRKWLGLSLALGVTVLAPLTQVQAQAPLNSTVQPTNTAQAPRMNLDVLQSHLAAQNWRLADAETRRLLDPWLHPGGDILGTPMSTTIPPEVLQTLDQLWVEASGGRFGFSVQQKIWAEVAAQNPGDSTAIAKAFGDRVGWTRPAGREDPTFIAGEWLTENELNSTLAAPVGHLPWAGVSWAQISRLLSVESCGSCTIDAMYVQGERFHRHLPIFFNWVETALNLAVPPVGSWQQPRLARTIDLRSLYPNSQCPIRTTATALSPNGQVMAIGSYSYDRSCATPGESTLALWNPERGIRIVTLHRGPVQAAEGDRIVGAVANAVAFTPDGQRVAAGMANGTVRIWSATTGQPVRTLEGHRAAVRAIALSSNGQILATASADQTIKLWHLPTGQLRRTISMAAADGMVHTLLFSPDGRRLATATDQNSVQLWDADSGQLVRTLVNRATALQPPLPIAFSPNGQTLATGDRDRSVKLWNATTGARQITLTGHTDSLRQLAFSPDGTRLASSDGTTARLWHLQTYTAVHSLALNQSAGHPVRPPNLGRVAFSPDGQTLATSTLLLPLRDSEPIPRQGLTLWSVATGQPLAQLHEVGEFQFSPNGQFLLAQGQTVQLWQPHSALVGDRSRVNP